MNQFYPSSPKSQLRFWHGLIAFFSALFFQILLGFLLIVLAQIGGNSFVTPVAMAIQVCLTITVLVALSVGFAAGKEKSVSDIIGLNKPGAVLTVIAVLGVLPLGMLADEITFFLHNFNPGIFDSAGLEMMAGVFKGASTGSFIVLTTAVTLGPAIGEELMFRGLIFSSFKKDMPLWAAVFLSSGLFGFLHLNMLQGIGAFAIGLYLAFVVIKTGSIWPAVIAHGVNNLTCSLFVRFDPEGAGRAFMEGHSFTVLLPALALSVIAVGLLWRFGRTP